MVKLHWIDLILIPLTLCIVGDVYCMYLEIYH